jgi:hypothetical protein
MESAMHQIILTVSPPSNLDVRTESELIISVPHNKITETLSAIQSGKFTLIAQTHLEVTRL